MTAEARDWDSLLGDSSIVAWTFGRRRPPVVGPGRCRGRRTISRDCEEDRDGMVGPICRMLIRWACVRRAAAREKVRGGKKSSKKKTEKTFVKFDQHRRVAMKCWVGPKGERVTLVRRNPLKATRRDAITKWRMAEWWEYREVEGLEAPVCLMTPDDFAESLKLAEHTCLTCGRPSRGKVETHHSVWDGVGEVFWWVCPHTEFRSGGMLNRVDVLPENTPEGIAAWRGVAGEPEDTWPAFEQSATASGGG